MNFGKAMLVSTVIMAVIVVVIVAVNACGLLITWPIMFCGYYFCNAAGMEMKRIPGLAAWGAVGLLAGVFEPYLAAAYGEVVALLGLLAAAIVVIALGLTSGLPKMEAHFMLLMLTVATGGTHLMTVDAMPQIWIGYAVGVVVMVAVGALKSAISARGRRKAANSAAREEGEADLA